MRIPQSGLRLDSPAQPLLEGAVSYWGITSGAGAAGGTTVVCADLVNEPSYVGHAVKMLDGGAAGQVRLILADAAGVLTVLAFTNAAGAPEQTVANTRFVILSMGGGGGVTPVLPIAEATGSLNYDETNAAEQTLLTIVVAARSRIESIWLDAVNVTQVTTVRLYHQIDGATYRQFAQYSFDPAVDSDGVLIDGFTAYRSIQLSLQCGGGGAGIVAVPYAVV